MFVVKHILAAAWLAAWVLLPAPAAASGPDPEALLDSGAKAERKYAVDEAASFYAKAAQAALQARECETLLRAAEGMKRCLMMGGDRKLADGTARGLLEAGAPGCAIPALAQLAFGVGGSGKDPAPALDWLDAGMKNAPTEADRLYLGRVHALVVGGSVVDYFPYEAPSAAMNPLSEWFQTAAHIETDRRDQVVTGEDAWRGPEDGSMWASIVQFSQNLYIAFRVTDDDEQTGPDGDAVVLSLALGSEGAAPHRRSPLSKTPAVQLRVPATTTINPGTVEGPCDRCWTITRVRPGGYDVLLCLPHGGLPGFNLEPGDSYAFDVALEDRDADGRTVLRAWGLTPDLTDVFLGGRVTSVFHPNLPNN